jgi:hypothetical protein
LTPVPSPQAYLDAAQSLFGAGFSVTRQRGQIVDSALAPFATATVYPSSILRAPDASSRHEQLRVFINDLTKVAALAINDKARQKIAAAV